jgi:hypothetical protein
VEKQKREREELPLGRLAEQVGRVLAAVRAEPTRRRQILTAFVVRFLGAVKETIRAQGRIVSLYMLLSDPVDFGTPPVTAEVSLRAKQVKAEAIVWVEGFQSEKDIGDVIYHVALSAPGMGVLGWVLKVKLADGRVEFTREMPYHFDTPEKVRSLGELVEEMENK